MRVVRVNVPLYESEAKALLSMSAAHDRHPREQARLLIREAAIECGLLLGETDTLVRDDLSEIMAVAEKAPVLKAAGRDSVG